MRRERRSWCTYRARLQPEPKTEPRLLIECESATVRSATRWCSKWRRLEWLLKKLGRLKKLRCGAAVAISSCQVHCRLSGSRSRRWSFGSVRLRLRFVDPSFSSTIVLLRLVSSEIRGWALPWEHAHQWSLTNSSKQRADLRHCSVLVKFLILFYFKLTFKKVIGTL
jgi:hypothetical protein